MPTPPDSRHLVDHLFRHEAGRMVAALTRLLGFDRLEVAEDIVQETMIQALKSWPLAGIPEQPSAWLYRVAKNKALDALRREKTLRQIGEAWTDNGFVQTEEAMDHFFFEDEITDSQLRMLFACCHPSIAFESQVTMCLKILCGLSVREIANAFLTSDETITKRLYRAKEKIRSGEIRLEVPQGTQLPARLDAVLNSLYLLFNEGYNSSHPDELIRRDLCLEAMRLCLLVTQHPKLEAPEAHALLALMCFQAARFDARTDGTGAIVLLKDQDRTTWSRPLLDRAGHHLAQSARGDTLSRYHLEAAIACQHALAPRYEATNWPVILQYYDALLEQYPSPVVALSRAVALWEVEGPLEALIAVLRLEGLETNQYYHTLLADLYQQTGQADRARAHYDRALGLTSSAAEKQLIEKKKRRIEERNGLN
ncbi:RNA polymerase sigma factor [Tellurirhabdus rosea]|uniref:RNA polymerase sigma factor n=1 Tax=Tellurirhabdus rosea TaxID=2674997 RepID=UPI00225A08DC|nr:sigma-70 family RNA polymerase sigma factor [Tellurirhabdus rosea]